MNKLQILKSALIGGASVLLLAQPAAAKIFNIPDGDLATALSAYMQQSGIDIVYLGDVVRGHRSHGAKGDYTETAALMQILRGTGFTAQAMASNTIGIVPQTQEPAAKKVAQLVRHMSSTPAPTMAAAVETVVVTAQKKSENIQNVPIAVTALSQQQLTERQIAAGPDLVKEVPNLTFTKTNFTGYNLEIRGIGTEAISVTTDPAVAVAFNEIPFIRNHFFEQEFFDVDDVEVLRGPQGTLYGRNATAGVVDIKSAQPTDQYEAMLSADVGNYNGRRLEGMLNVPIIGDMLDLRVAGEWTKRDGYTFDTTTDSSVDGRDLWSGRASVIFRPTSHITADLVYEHFNENDDRLNSGKTLCTTDPGPSSVNGPAGLVTNIDASGSGWLSQGCLPGSLYAPSAYGEPNPYSIPYIATDEFIYYQMNAQFNPFASSQSEDLRQIGSDLLPHYMAKNDTLDFNINYQIIPEITLTSATGYNKDFLYSTEDYYNFATLSGAFPVSYIVGQDGEFCDPQLGCSNALTAQDVSEEHSEQFYQEIRATSNFSGPINFSFGSNYMYYQTDENYFVFINALTLLAEDVNGDLNFGQPYHNPFNPVAANACGPVESTYDERIPGIFGLGCSYIDPNPLADVNGQGHNYFRSDNPYRLHSWAGFGEVYYTVMPDVKLTAGLRYTEDTKIFTEIPSWTLLAGEGYPIGGVLTQNYDAWTGRFNATWTPSLYFTDQSLFYGSYARGYKAGGANPPGVEPNFIGSISFDSPSNATHPLTFAPEYVDAFEIGTKNTLLDGKMTLNGDAFFYAYQGYQISEIVDRTSVNLNFNATVRGAEVESTWEPLPGLRFNLSGGYEDGTLNHGDQAIDLMDRTAGTPGWMVVQPFITETSNCVLPTYVVNELLSAERASNGGNNSTPAPLFFGIASTDWSALNEACLYAYTFHVDPGSRFGVSTGFDPSTAPNNGEGFDKNLAGNKLPNMPPFTLSFGTQYSMPVSEDWVGTLRGDFYWQGNTEARVFNDKPYDSIHGYSNLNLALIFDNSDGWQTMIYVKNVFNVTAITGDYLNSDDSGLTTNVFLTDPRLFGVRLTKRF